MRQIPVFFYGLFMDAELLRSKGVEPVRERHGTVNGFELRIGARAALVPADGQRVHGVVMDLTHAEIDRLYGDASVSLYRAEPVLVETADGTLPALTFNLPEPPRSDEFNPDYAAKLNALKRRLGVS